MFERWFIDTFRIIKANITTNFMFYVCINDVLWNEIGWAETFAFVKNIWKCCVISNDCISRVETLNFIINVSCSTVLNACIDNWSQNNGIFLEHRLLALLNQSFGLPEISGEMRLTFLEPNLNYFIYISFALQWL